MVGGGSLVVGHRPREIVRVIEVGFTDPVAALPVGLGGPDCAGGVFDGLLDEVGVEAVSPLTELVVEGGLGVAFIRDEIVGLFRRSRPAVLDGFVLAVLVLGAGLVEVVLPVGGNMSGMRTVRVASTIYRVRGLAGT